jgi:hypothetical protein
MVNIFMSLRSRFDFSYGDSETLDCAECYKRGLITNNKCIAEIFIKINYCVLYE